MLHLFVVSGSDTQSASHSLDHGSFRQPQRCLLGNRAAQYVLIVELVQCKGNDGESGLYCKKWPFLVSSSPMLVLAMKSTMPLARFQANTVPHWCNMARRSPCERRQENARRKVDGIAQKESTQQVSVWPMYVNCFLDSHHAVRTDYECHRVQFCYWHTRFQIWHILWCRSQISYTEHQMKWRLRFDDAGRADASVEPVNVRSLRMAPLLGHYICGKVFEAWSP